MREIAQSGILSSYCGQDDSSSQNKSHDTIGTIPRVGTQTGAAIPGDVEATVARSISEVWLSNFYLGSVGGGSTTP